MIAGAASITTYLDSSGKRMRLSIERLKTIAKTVADRLESRVPGVARPSQGLDHYRDVMDVPVGGGGMRVPVGGGGMRTMFGISAPAAIACFACPRL